MQKKYFTDIVLDLLLAASIDVKIISDSAVVLERLARGGGATNWYYCTDRRSLDYVAQKLHPGAVVSFYFDRRLDSLISAPGTFSRLKGMITDGEILVGTLADNNVDIDMEMPCGEIELEEHLSSIGNGKILFYGLFPNRDNDGANAITLTLPDIDGVVRNHPH